MFSGNGASKKLFSFDMGLGTVLDSGYFTSLSPGTEVHDDSGWTCSLSEK